VLKTTSPRDTIDFSSSSLFYRDPEPLSSSMHPQSHRATQMRRARNPNDHERRIRLAREPGESHRDRP
jgi:hypothetical protein